jgi:tRNA-specific 2-thiouridylase
VVSCQGRVTDKSRNFGLPRGPPALPLVGSGQASPVGGFNIGQAEMSRKAIALMSGGLDSALAVKIVQDLGIDVLAIHFAEPICSNSDDAEKTPARLITEKLGMPLKTIVIGQEYLDMIIKPRFGYGSGMNPCTDCHIMMLVKAREMMAEQGASFVVTGEVLGQRPMSQTAHRLKTVEHESGLEGLLLRPLSAKCLLPSVPEKEGWVDREKLFGIQGRSRREQLALAKQLNIEDYSSPAGGCLLTEKHFAAILRDHLRCNKLLMADVPLLKLGRHFRLPGGAKFVVGRNKAENQRLFDLVKEGDILFVPANAKGPVGLLKAPPQDEAVLNQAAGIVAGYCDGEGSVEVTLRSGADSRKVTSERRERSSFDGWKI